PWSVGAVSKGFSASGDASGFKGGRVSVWTPLVAGPPLASSKGWSVSGGEEPGGVQTVPSGSTWLSLGGNQLQEPAPPKPPSRWEGTRSAAFARFAVFSAIPRRLSRFIASSAATGPFARRSRMATFASSNSEISPAVVGTARSCSAVWVVGPIQSTFTVKPAGCSLYAIDENGADK